MFFALRPDALCLLPSPQHAGTWVCHCRACTRSKGGGPAWLVAVGGEYVPRRGSNFPDSQIGPARTAHAFVLPKRRARSAIEYIKGGDLVKTIEAPDAYGAMTHTFCTNCGSHIYQNPKGMPMKAFYASVFEYENGKNTSQRDASEKPSSKNPGVSCVLPEHLMPKLHANYENRLMDYNDDLPKYKDQPAGFGGSDKQLNNDGTPK